MYHEFLILLLICLIMIKTMCGGGEAAFHNSSPDSNIFMQEPTKESSPSTKNQLGQSEFFILLNNITT